MRFPSFQMLCNERLVLNILNSETVVNQSTIPGTLSGLCVCSSRGLRMATEIAFTCMTAANHGSSKL